MKDSKATLAKQNAANTQAMLSEQTAEANIAMLKDLVDTIFENEEAFEDMSFADAIDALEAELSGVDCLGMRVI